MSRASYQNLHGISIGHGHKKLKRKNKKVDKKNPTSTSPTLAYQDLKPKNRPILRPKF